MNAPPVGKSLTRNKNLAKSLITPERKQAYEDNVKRMADISGTPTQAMFETLCATFLPMTLSSPYSKIRPTMAEAVN